MKLGNESGNHLTYCTNIHPGERWTEVRSNLEHYLPLIKKLVSPNGPFGVGLRLSAIAASELQGKDTLEEFKAFLHANDLYVFTINGFAYGPFNGVPVKEEVYLPDWRSEKRLEYTNILAEILAQLLTSKSMGYGSISTVPGGFKPHIKSASDIEQMTNLLLRHTAYLIGLERQTGVHLSLALEPEPCCFIETIEETISFFENHIFSSAACGQLGDLVGLSFKEAELALRRHVGICLDLCHAAVEYEDPNICLDQISRSGISICKMQISSGLRIPIVTDNIVESLRPFHNSVYLHQVVEQSPRGLRRFLDLPQAFQAISSKDELREWRVHFHVPVFLNDLAAFSTTQSFICEVLGRHRIQSISSHLEVETYTWDVLPEVYRNCDLTTAIARELQWTKAQLA